MYICFSLDLLFHMSFSYNEDRDKEGWVQKKEENVLLKIKLQYR